MNGVLEIEIKGQKHTLRFGVQAGLLFKSYIVQHKMKAGTLESNYALLGDLFYCGLYGEAIRKQRQPLTYEEAMDLFDEFGSEENFANDSNRMWAAWGESSAGHELINLSQQALKKKEELNAQP